MNNPSPYVKMQVLGAIEFAEGRTIRERIKKVNQTTFHDEEGNPYRFTWRTIDTWLYRYKLHGVTALEPKGRSDKGKTRKVSPEQVLEAIEQVLPCFRAAGATTKAHIMDLVSFSENADVVSAANEDYLAQVSMEFLEHLA